VHRFRYDAEQDTDRLARVERALHVISMKLKSILLKKRDNILRAWYEIILDAYPEETSQIFRKEKDRFSNPVAFSVSDGIEKLFDGLIEKKAAEQVAALLDNLIRIRAVQDFTPAQALSFVFLLKNVVRDALAGEIEGNTELFTELLEFESQVDRQALYTFNVYMKCRERLYDIRAREARRNTFRLLQQARLASELKDPEADVTRMPAS